MNDRTQWQHTPSPLVMLGPVATGGLFWANLYWAGYLEVHPHAARALLGSWPHKQRLMWTVPS